MVVKAEVSISFNIVMYEKLPNKREHLFIFWLTLLYSARIIQISAKKNICSLVGVGSITRKHTTVYESVCFNVYVGYPCWTHISGHPV